MRLSALRKEDLMLYAVTDSSLAIEQTLADQVESAICGGVTMVQLREKTLETDAFITHAQALKAITDMYRVPLIINDDIAVAKAIKAAGVHVGQSDHSIGYAREQLGSDAIIGVSVRTVEEAVNAERSGADYIGVGAVFPTKSKADAMQVDHKVLKDIAAAVTIPVVAIGGIQSDNIECLSGLGIDGVAIISAIFASDDIKAATADLLERVKKVVGTVAKKSDWYAHPVLTIAGSDCSGGAGIQADLKTIEAHGLYGMSVITALTAQNTCGVSGVHDVPSKFVTLQLAAIFDDIVPKAIKVGMVSSTEIISVISNHLNEIKRIHPNIPIVIDPVMVATSGSRLLSENATGLLKTMLLPLATLITPNLPEAEILSGITITNKDDMIKAAEAIAKDFTCHILIKGGHMTSDSDDLLYHDATLIWLKQTRIDNPNTHGTGCTLSSAIACALANGKSVESAVTEAKDYITGALMIPFDVGKGSGPLYHSYKRLKTT